MDTGAGLPPSGRTVLRLQELFGLLRMSSSCRRKQLTLPFSSLILFQVAVLLSSSLYTPSPLIPYHILLSESLPHGSFCGTSCTSLCSSCLTCHLLLPCPSYHTSLTHTHLLPALPPLPSIRVSPVQVVWWRALPHCNIHCWFCSVAAC